MRSLRALLAATLGLCAVAAWADDATFKPFILASSGPGDLDARVAETVTALEAAGFEVAGSYRPLEDTAIVVVTDEALRAVAAGSERGGYAAAQRVSVTATGDAVEVAFVNPLYLQHAYRLEGDLEPVHERLVEALGMVRACGGGDKKMTAKKLRKYNYMVGMQKFDDPSELGRFANHADAVAAVERGLAREGDGLTQIYRIEVPGNTPQTLIGVGMKSVGDDDEDIDEAAQMAVVDFEGCRKRAYFPYEVLVNGSEVEALHMRFRMAVHFPNLSMMGQHGFTKLMPFPGAIEDALEGVVEE